MLNVIFYTASKTKEKTYKTYDTSGTLVEVPETEHYHTPKSYACETMTSGDLLFSYDDDLEDFNGSMRSMTTAKGMFDNSSVTSVSDGTTVADFRALTDGERMFADCKSLTSVKIKLSSIKNGREMFINSPITEFVIEGLESLENGQYMFSACPMSSFDYDLTGLVDGESMFEKCPNLVDFSGKLSNVVNLNKAFKMCGVNVEAETPTIGLSSFDTDNLDRLQTAQETFVHSALESWNYHMPMLNNGVSMFADSSLLTTFRGDLSSLITATNMFSNCTALTSFISNLTSLDSADGMFNGCKLDANSIMYLVDSLPTHTEGEHLITIGIGCESNQNSLDTFAEEAMYENWITLKEILSNKGWTVTWQDSSSNTITI